MQLNTTFAQRVADNWRVLINYMEALSAEAEQDSGDEEAETQRPFGPMLGGEMV